jgi:O-antigen/teichoic acid export membrane protein
MKEHLKALFFSSASSLTTVLFSIITTKLIAAWLGPTGIGVMAQIIILISSIINISVLGSNTGIVKYVSQYHDTNPEKLRALRKTVFRGVFGLSLLLIIIGLIFAKHISTLLFNTDEYAPHISLALMSQPAVLITLLMTTYLNGLSRIKELTAVTIYNAIVSTGLVILGIWLFGLLGFYAASAASAIAGVAVTYLTYRKFEPEHLLKDIFHTEPNDVALIKKLFALGAAMTVVSLSGDYAQLLIRTRVIEIFGVQGNGIFQASWALATRYLNIVQGALLTFTIPLMSKLTDDKDLVRETNKAFRLSVLVVVPMIILLFILREQLVVILYSEKFLEAAEILTYQLAADLFQIMMWAIWVVFLVRERTIALVVMEICFYLLFVGLTFYTLPLLGLKGIAIAYLISCMLFFLSAVLLQRRYIAFTFEKKNVRLLWISVLTVGVLMFFVGQSFWVNTVLGSVLLIGWAAFSLQKEEAEKMILFVQSKLIHKK